MRGKAVFALVVVALASACGERSEPISELPSAYPVTVRGASDRATRLERAPERIVALDPGSAELLAALGAERRLVGVPAGFTGSARLEVPVVVRPSGRVDVGAVARIAPDLIVATRSTNRMQVAQAERETRAAVYVQPDASIADVERAAVELGFLTGRPVRARRLVRSIRADVTSIEARVASREPVRVFVDMGFLITAPERSLVADLVRRAGGESVVGGSSSAEPYELCEVARRRPDVFLRVTDPTDRRNRPAPSFERCGLAPTAVSFVELRGELVARAGPRVADALAAVARALHPDAFR